jgi:hypothetical protein
MTDQRAVLPLASARIERKIPKKKFKINIRMEEAKVRGPRQADQGRCTTIDRE